MNNTDMSLTVDESPILRQRSAYLLRPARSDRVTSVICAVPLILLALPFLAVALYPSGNLFGNVAGLCLGLPVMALGISFFYRGVFGYRHTVEFSEQGLSYPLRKNKPCLPFADIRHINFRAMSHDFRIAGGADKPVIRLRSGVPCAMLAFYSILKRVPIDADIDIRDRSHHIFSTKIFPGVVILWFLCALATIVMSPVEGMDKSLVILIIPTILGCVMATHHWTRRSALQAIYVQNEMLVFSYRNREESFPLSDVQKVRLDVAMNEQGGAYLAVIIEYRDSRFRDIRTLPFTPVTQDPFGLYVYLRRELHDWQERQRELGVMPESENS
jgi:uncharacterized membrane protein